MRRTHNYHLYNNGDFHETYGSQIYNGVLDGLDDLNKDTPWNRFVDKLFQVPLLILWFIVKYAFKLIWFLLVLAIKGSIKGIKYLINNHKQKANAYNSNSSNTISHEEYNDAQQNTETNRNKVSVDQSKFTKFMN